MKQLILIALGGAAGALSRYWLVALVGSLSTRLPDGEVVVFPFGTFIVNALGSFLIGVCYVCIVEKMVLHPDWRQVLMIGFLGAFTTFSTFSLETISLLENGHTLQAAIYVVASLLLCILFTSLAIYFTRMF